MLIVGSLLQVGVQRAHVLYLAWALLGLLIMHTGWTAAARSSIAARAVAVGACAQSVLHGCAGSAAPFPPH